jgi:hypothetical protein
MKKNAFFSSVCWRIIAAISVTLFFAGCATTHSITFASAEQPDRDSGSVMVYKHVAIKIRSFDSSVLERFYAMYPNHKYQVVAYEKVNKKYWMPMLGIGGGLVLGLFGSIGDGGEGFLIGLPIGALIGSIVGYFMDGTYYVITYVER